MNKEERREYLRKWRSENKDKVSAYNAAQHAKNRDAVNRKRRERRAEEKKRGIDKVHEYEMKKLYGITVAEYNKRLADQEWSCAVCRVDADQLQRRLNVDHCHKSLKVRGLLCGSCNRAIGLFKDNPEVMRRAADYISMEE